jgi:NADP-dependent 3-hydroxy acid dehydrogenase YdfG
MQNRHEYDGDFSMDVARAVAFVIGQPAEAEIGDLVIRPSVQN